MPLARTSAAGPCAASSRRRAPSQRARAQRQLCVASFCSEISFVVVGLPTVATAIPGPQFLDPISLIGDDSEALPRAPLALRWPTHPAPLGAVLLRARVGRHCRRVGVLRQLPCPGRARSPKESRAREHVRRRRRQHLHTKWPASQLDAPGFCVAPAFSGISAGDAAAILLSVRAPLRAARHSRCAEHVEPGNLTFLCQFALQGIPALKIALKMMEDASFPPR